MRTLLRAGYVLGFDGSDHVWHRDAEVVYENDKIIHVGRGWRRRVDQTHDLGRAMVVPGLIDLDALADIDHALLDAWAPTDLSLGHQWSEGYFRQGRRDVFTLEERLFIREYALIQLLLHGITTCMPIAAETHSAWAETFDEAVGMAEVGQRLGIRAYLGPSYRSGVNVVRPDGTRDVLWEPALGERGLADARRFLEHVATLPGDLVRGALLPCRIETLTVDLVKDTANTADEYGALVRLHCLQSPLELGLLRRWYDATPIELLRGSGLLGPRLLIPHGIYVGGHSRQASPGAGDVAALAAAGVSVINCPMTSLRYGHVLESFDRYRAAGVNLALGTDSFPPDLVRGMDYGSNLAKWVDGRLDAGAAADYFRAATLGGARALGRDDLGRLAPGAQADLVVFDLSDVRMGVLDDPLRTLLMNGSARDATMTVVAGRTVMRDRRIPGVDLAALHDRAQELFHRMRAAYADRDYRRRSADELFPGSFARATDPRATRHHEDDDV